MSYSNASYLIQPSQLEGRGKLSGCSFNSRCPPIVTPDSIIVAVCGPNDFADNASPAKDGVFFSDFFLFHHLYRGTAKHQFWLTCIDPRNLIDKYQEFMHGDPRKDERRVVLDATMQEDVKDIVVVDGNNLIERFLSTVAMASKDVKSINHPILILIFGHGAEDSFAVTIGGKGSFNSCPKMEPSHLRNALYRHNSKPNVGLLTTSCYGGGWVETPFLNITAMAGVSQEQELMSWPEAMLKRACGSHFATGVTEALIKIELEDLRSESSPEWEMRNSPTYAALVEVIHDTLHKEIDPRIRSDLSFSAQDDLWNEEWRVQTCFPLKTYQSKWQVLRRAPRTIEAGESQVASVRLSNSINLTTSAAEHRVKYLAHEYMNSYPGDDSRAKNHHLHSACRSLLEGEHLPAEELEIVAASIRYRLEGIMGRASQYKNRLGLDFKDCRLCDVDDYINRVTRIEKDREELYQLHKLIYSFDLFDEPEDNEGLPYVRGNWYLAMVIRETRWPIDRVKDALQQLAKLKNELSPYHRTVRIMQFLDDRKVRDMLGTLAKSTKRRLRRLSPSKHPRKSLEGVFSEGSRS